jgi:hypothetical protein
VSFYLNLNEEDPIGGCVSVAGQVLTTTLLTSFANESKFFCIFFVLSNRKILKIIPT